ncbi:hypothetical protein [Allosalinactinospora lopnorensis]|uniref:hypothetical protein n=1 Tax=Allosalinactinospora lopnorensis TaxID=1352348 RepID=UPI000623D7B3|nr:hypothetical protein [Allosalinactinospora lopnorensis]
MRDDSITSVVVLDHQPIIRAAFSIIALIRPDLSFVCTDSESELLQTVRSGYDVVIIDPTP